MDIPLAILAFMSLGFTFWMFIAEETHLAVIAGIMGMVSSFACAGYWLAAETAIPGIAWVFGGLGLVDVVWTMAEGVMTAYPGFRRKVVGIDPE